jgi:RHH-type transcriptional regulator, rel operon repressor / antitoxin RelB
LSIGTTTVRIPAELGKRLTQLAKKTGRTKSFYARKAIEMSLEDLEDTVVALERMENPGRIWTMEEVEASLGLDD